MSVNYQRFLIPRNQRVDGISYKITANFPIPPLVFSQNSIKIQTYDQVFYSATFEIVLASF